MAAIQSGRPHAIGKIGSVELQSLRAYLRYRGNSDLDRLVAPYGRELYTNAGVFPENLETYSRFCRYMLEKVLPELSLLIVFFTHGEAKVARTYCPDADRATLRGLGAFRWASPWTSALEGKRVLVLSPFPETVKTQYPKRELVWGSRRVLPQFELECISVPPHAHMVAPKTQSWFESLDEMKQRMVSRDFDVALIGAGAYSLPLAVHAKALGKQGIHLGGDLQILFGIRGKRWDDRPEFAPMFNEHWIRPLPSEVPPRNESVEGGCYW